jgi:hypothetical protein
MQPAPRAGARALPESGLKGCWTGGVPEASGCERSPCIDKTILVRG